MHQSSVQWKKVNNNNKTTVTRKCIVFKRVYVYKFNKPASALAHTQTLTIYIYILYLRVSVVIFGVQALDKKKIKKKNY